MRKFYSHQWQESEARLLAFTGAENKEVKIPEAMQDQTKHQEDKEATEKTDELKNKEKPEESPEAAVKRAEKLQRETEKKAAELETKVRQTNERNRAIETDVTFAKDATMVGLLTPDSQPIKTPIPESQIATLQQPEKADTRAQANAAEQKEEEKIIQPESQPEGRQSVS